MRLISTFLLGLIIFSCSSKNSVLTKKEFAMVYMDSLSKRYPTVKFELNPDFSISSNKGESDYKHFVDNAFVAYTNEPESLNDIISIYIASTADLYTDPVPIDIRNIVPVIKPVEYVNEINLMSNDGKSIPMVTEKYNDQLIITYAEDTKTSIKYLTEDDFKTLSISRDTLKSVALRNFDKIIPNIQRQGENGLFMVTAGGDYEASLILLTTIWTKENFPVDGDFVIAIPNRDMLLITGSNNQEAIAKTKKIVADSYNTGNYQVSDNLYKWTGNRFEMYK